MTEAIEKRISEKTGIADISEILSHNLSGADLHSLLLDVFKKRVLRGGLPSLTQISATTDRCNLYGRLLNQVESIGYDIAAGFRAVELSPLVPLGSVAQLTGLDQANVLSTIRALECASDPTIGLALECARVRRTSESRKRTTKLCSNQRVIRFPVPKKTGYTAHFKLFGLISAGRDSGSFNFEISALREHIHIYLSFLEKLSTTNFEFRDITVEVSHTKAIEHLCSVLHLDRDVIRASVRARDSQSADRLLAQFGEKWPNSLNCDSNDVAQFNFPAHVLMQIRMLEKKVCRPLARQHDGVRCELNLSRLTGLSYYQGPCFHIKIKTAGGETLTLADGGFVDWTQRLLTDSKERLMASAIGTELLCRSFHGQPAESCENL